MRTIITKQLLKQLEFMGVLGINFKQENNVIVYCISKTSVDDSILTV